VGLNKLKEKYLSDSLLSADKTLAKNGAKE